MKTEITIKEIDITPHIAERWLNKCNTHNRSLYESTVESYALDMKRGFWALNHQPIAFDDEGILMDGQHRLAAIVRSGKTIRMLVAQDIPKQFDNDGVKHFTQETIDGGKPRSVGDRINLTYGIENANLKTAISIVIVNLCIGKNIKATPSLILEILKIYGPEINIVIGNRSYKPGLIYAPVLGSFAFAAKCFKEKTIEFEIGYFKGENLFANSPILTFRNFMLAKKAWHGSGSYRRSVMNACLISLMYFIQEQPLKRIITGCQGLDFFVNKQKRVVTEICELSRL